MDRSRWIWSKVRVAGALALTLAAASGPPLATACKSSSGACCKVCTTGKACGNSCIAKTDTCNQPPGCACNG